MPRVGTRDMDVHARASNLPRDHRRSAASCASAARCARRSSTLSADELAEYDQYEHVGRALPAPVPGRARALVNLADDYTRTAGCRRQRRDRRSTAIADDDDPLIVPPLYGGGTPSRSADPGRRGRPTRPATGSTSSTSTRATGSPAGFGTDVVQKNQEDYMEAAWQQVGEVLEAQPRIRLAQLGCSGRCVWHARELAPPSRRPAERLLALTAPVQPAGARRRPSRSAIARRGRARCRRRASTPMRAALRPGGPRGAAARRAGGRCSTTVLDRRSTTARSPPRRRRRCAGICRPGATSRTSSLRAACTPAGSAGAPALALAPPASAGCDRWLVRGRCSSSLLLLVPLPLRRRGVAGGRSPRSLAVCRRLLPRARARADRAPSRCGRRLDDARGGRRAAGEPGLRAHRRPAGPDAGAPSPAARDSADGRALQGGAREDRPTRVDAPSAGAGRRAPPAAARPRIGSADASSALDPARTVPRGVLGRIAIPRAHRRRAGRGRSTRSMAYPEIDVPMYEPLERLSTSSSCRTST